MQTNFAAEAERSLILPEYFSRLRDDMNIALLEESVSIRRSFQLPTISAPTMAPSAMSVRRASPRHMTVLPGGGSLARAR